MQDVRHDQRVIPADPTVARTPGWQSLAISLGLLLAEMAPPPPALRASRQQQMLQDRRRGPSASPRTNWSRPSS
jgi:hypothetical protein